MDAELTLRKHEAERTAVFAEGNFDASPLMIDAHNTVEPNDNLVSRFGVSKLSGEYELTVVAEVKGAEFLTGRLPTPQKDRCPGRLVVRVFGVPTLEFLVRFDLEAKKRPTPLNWISTGDFPLGAKDANLRPGRIDHGKFASSQQQVFFHVGTFQVHTHGRLVSHGAEGQ